MTKAKKTTHTQRAHAKLSASGSYRWMNCPGQPAFSAQFPESESTPAAEEGTAAHELADKCLTTGKPARAWLGKIINKHEVTKEMADHIQDYVDHVNGLQFELGSKLSIEERFDLSWVFPEMFGTNDACNAQLGDLLIITDLKYGVMPVEVHRNSQLMYYALGAAKKHSFNFKRIRIEIYQPRAFHEDGPVRQDEFPIEVLHEFTKTLRAAAKKTHSLNAPLVAGDWCTFCPCAPGCDAFQKRAMKAIEADFDDTTSTLPKVTMLSDEKTVEIIKNAKIFESFIKQVKKHTKERLLSGENIKGLKLVQGKNRREWCDSDDAGELLTMLLGDQAYESKLLSVAKAESLLSKKELKDYWLTVKGEATIAHESDRRKSIGTSIENDFEVLGEARDVTPKEDALTDF